MASIPQNSSTKGSTNNITEEYRILHKVAQILQASGELKDILQNALRAITGFEELKVENKAGVFLVDENNKVLRLFTTFGKFSKEFLENEKEVPFGNCLCGRVAESGQILMSESCFSDPRHEIRYDDMTAHGHYIVPLKASEKLVGVMFLYTNTNPDWYQHSQEVLLSIGGLIANVIEKKKVDDELEKYRNHLVSLVKQRTNELTNANARLLGEVENHEKTQGELRQLGIKTEKIREEEKHEISRKVHDELGQLLTALKIDLLQLDKKLPQENSDLRQRAHSIVDLVDDTIKSVQGIAMELRPPILDAFGLCEAIAWQAGEYEKRYGIQFNLNCLQKYIELDKDLEIALFRIFQESVTNVVRHSEANQVSIEVLHEGGQLVMKIQDNGVGIQKDKINDSNSIGLIGIRERVRSWEGEVQFLGTDGKGTTVEIRIPIARK
jgi:signal transduction histidine kinase